MMAAWLGDIIPELVLASAVVVLLPMGPFLPARHKGAATWLAVAALLAAGAATVPLLGTAPHASFDGTYAVDPFAAYFKLAAIAATAIVLLVTRGHFRGGPHEGDVPTLLVLACLGIVGLAASQDLVLIALFITLVTVVSYVLAGIAKEDVRGAEGALKLLLFGAVAMGVMFYGMTLLYGLTGTLNLLEIARRLPGSSPVAAAVALVFVLAGYGFKVTLTPFHFWAPDVYQGAPTPISAYLSVAPKAAGLAVLVRTLAVGVPAEFEAWRPLIAVLAAVTMTVGNLAALRQTNLKRLLAYSSIAQVGYLLMGVAALGRDVLALQGVLVYFTVYVVMNLAAFLTVAAIGRALGSDEMEQYAGLGRAMPGAALALAISLLALAGFPPMGSYVGKAMLFAAAMRAELVWLAIAGALNSAISLFYYARVLEAVYLRRGDGEARAAPGYRVPAATTLAVSIAGLATLLAGVIPQPLLALARQASRILDR